MALYDEIMAGILEKNAGYGYDDDVVEALDARDELLKTAADILETVDEIDDSLGLEKGAAPLALPPGNSSKLVSEFVNPLKSRIAELEQKLGHRQATVDRLSKEIEKIYIPEILKHKSKARSMRNVAIGTTVGGGALALGGTAYGLHERAKRKRQEREYKNRSLYRRIMNR